MQPFNMLSNGMFYVAIHAFVDELQVEINLFELPEHKAYSPAQGVDRVIRPWLLNALLKMCFFFNQVMTHKKITG